MQVSYIGMQTQEVAIKTTLKIVMKADAQQLEEVMVVALALAKMIHDLHESRSVPHPLE